MKKIFLNEIEVNGVNADFQETQVLYGFLLYFHEFGYLSTFGEAFARIGQGTLQMTRGTFTTTT